MFTPGADVADDVVLILLTTEGFEEPSPVFCTVSLVEILVVVCVKLLS